MSYNDANLNNETDDWQSDLAAFSIRCWEHRKLILLIVLAFSLIGFGVAISRDRVYGFSTTIEIGQRGGVISEDGSRAESLLIDSAQSVAAKLNESYIPLALQQQISGEQASISASTNLKARVPKDTNLVVLELTGKEGLSSSYLALLGKVTEMIKAEHLQVLELYRATLKIKISKAEQVLLELVDREKVIRSKQAQLASRERLYIKQIKDLNEQLVGMLRNRSSAYTSAGRSEPSAMTLMLIDRDIGETRNRLYEMEEKAYIELKNERENLEKELADLKRMQNSQVEAVSQAKMELGAVKETNAVIPPMRSLVPKAPGPTLIVILFMVVGMALAALVVALSNVFKLFNTNRKSKK